MQAAIDDMMHKTKIIKSVIKHRCAFFSLLFAVGIACWFAYPVGDLFSDDYSTLVFDCKGRLLRATLAGDQQYRFPVDTLVLPKKYLTALLIYEDKRFFAHPGVDPIALANAAVTNFKAGKRIRGGSTITMQVARLSGPKKRTYINKLYECFVAVKLSLHFSKEEVLNLYMSRVPMGGNIIGVPAASYLYYGKPATKLTWAEASLFVVLPNAPSMINLERERPLLKRKRNKLLKSLCDKGIINSFTYEMACQEPLPGRNRCFPFMAPHFTRLVLDQKRKSGRIATTLDRDVQNQVLEAAARFYRLLSHQGIANFAVLAAETETGKVRAYLGSHDFNDEAGCGQVDGVQALRSTGSLLKPFLIAKCLDKGPYTTASKVLDVPTFYGTFAPQNANKSFHGLVTVEQMLIRSLNVPFIRLLNEYGHREFYDLLVQGGLKGLFRDPDGYGLTLIVGGAEASLFELSRMYLALANMGRFQALRMVEGDGNRPSGERLFSEGAAWQVLNILNGLSRPGLELYWNQFNDQIPVAWKTGTSYGQKDGWAIGVNKQWTIGVWVGNFTGEGNAAIGGAMSAAPLLFTLFNLLTQSEQPMWFDEPLFDLKEVVCCKDSGYPAGPYCTVTKILKIPRMSCTPGTCPFHRRYLIDKHSGKSVCSLCWGGIETEWVTRFIVPPAARDILEKSGYPVETVPAHSAFCPNSFDDNRIEIVYPVNGIKIFIPRDFGGEHEKIVLSAKHQHPSMHLFWYLDGDLIGETVDHHQFAVELEPGSYTLSVQDEEGFMRTVSFTAFKKDT